MPIVRLTADDVAAARRDVGSSATTIAERAEQLGVGTTTLECALYGWTWRSVTDPGPLPLPPPAEITSPSARLSVQQVADMRRRYRAGTTTMGELARETGAAEGTVRNAVMGRTWRHCPEPPVPRADVGGWTVVSIEAEQTIVRMRAVQPPATYAEIAAATGLERTTVWRAAQRLKGEIEAARDGSMPPRRRAAQPKA
jgi:hypothetical protein